MGEEENMTLIITAQAKGALKSPEQVVAQAKAAWDRGAETAASQA